MLRWLARYGLVRYGPRLARWAMDAWRNRKAAPTRGAHHTAPRRTAHGAPTTPQGARSAPRR